MQYILRETPSPLPVRDQHTCAREILARLLREQYALTDYTIDVGENGKPYLKDHPQIRFNLSHCRTCVAAAVSDHEIGIDVERRFDWKEPLARRVCHPAEIEALLRCESAERKDQFNLLWSRKEAYLKCLGVGLGRDMRQLCIGTAPLTVSNGDGRFVLFQEQNERYTLVVCEQVQPAL